MTVGLASDTALFWSPEEYDPSSLPRWVADSYDRVLPYAREFLCAKHPYREGRVCPFVPSALRSGTILFSHCAESSSKAAQVQRVRLSAEHLVDKRGLSPSSSALLILFPHDYSVQELLDVHLETKEYCVRRSLMIGALFPDSMARSLHSADFFPLRTPIPTLVIRDMVLSDLQFLDQERFSLSNRIIFLSCFLATFEGAENHLAREQLKKANRLKIRYVVARGARWLLAAATAVFLGWMLWHLA